MFFGSHATFIWYCCPFTSFFLDMGTLLKRPAPTKQPHKPAAIPSKNKQTSRNWKFHGFGFHQHLGVSKKCWYTPKSSNLIGFSIIFTIHFGVTPIFGTSICLAETSMVWMSLVLWVICCCECSTSSWLAGARRSGGCWYKEVPKKKGVKESVLMVYAWIK